MATATTSKNVTIAALTEMLNDPMRLYRFTELATLTQRTTLVKSLLGLTESDIFIRTEIQRVRKHRGMDCRLARGNPAGPTQLRDLRSEERYMASVLMKMLTADNSGLLELDQEDNALLGNAVVDRLIYTYRRYLGGLKMSVEDAPLSFETFVSIYRAWVNSEVEFVACSNCGSEHLSTMTAHSARCPICHMHKHAVTSKRVHANRADAFFGKRSA
jgi:hypothetical protein